VKKRVQCFLWQGVYYELQTFLQPDIGLAILKTEVEAEGDAAASPAGDVVPMPWFLTVRGEITGVKEFSSVFLSQHFHDAAPQQGASWSKDRALLDAYERSRAQFASAANAGERE